MKKKILVTGGAGFIGSNLCQELVKNKDNMVICFDNLYTGSLDNIKQLISLPNFSFVYDNIIDSKFEDLSDIDEIYNAACPASPPAYQKDPLYTTKTCIFGLFNILNLAKKCGAKVLQFSTSEVYGNPLIHPQVETYFGNVNTTGIRSCYDEGKRCAESICFDYMRQYNLDVRVVRIFNTYGPNMDKADGRVVSNFINQALNDKPLTVYGNGEQTRSFCFVSDTVEALIDLMNLQKNPNTPINIGNPNEITIMQLVNILKQNFSNIKIEYRDLPADDPIKRQPDITLIKSLIGWEPKVQINSGLNLTIDYFKSRLEE